MDDHYRNPDSESPESLNSGDYLSQLKEKLKVQSQRIRSLESYKVLCEERLIELFPSHPLPVQPEHIGSGGPSVSQELLSSRQRIAKLEQQLSQTTELVPSPSNSMTYNKLHELYTLLHQKYNATVKEKNELEESLRNEVIASEEQRAYIEVLKQAIEIRVEALGLKGVRPEEFAEYSQNRISADVSRRENSRVSIKITDYESQIKSLTESLKIKTAEWAEASSDRDVLTEQLHQAAEALQFAEEEVQKLEEEKTNLIDYVETQSKIEQELTSELKDLKGRLQMFTEENKRQTKDLQKSAEESKKVFSELESVKNEFGRNEKTLKETQQSFVNLKARAEEKDKSILKYKEENNNLSIQNTGLQAENISLTENLAKTEQELRMNKSLLLSLKEENERIKDSFAQTKSSLQGVQEEKLRIERVNLETHNRLQDTTKEYDEVLQKFNASQKSLHNASFELETAKSQLRIAADKEESASQLIQEIKKQSQKFQIELDNLIKVQQSTNNELKLVKQENEENKLKVLALNRDKELLEGKIRELTMKVEEESHTLRLSQSENKELLYKLEDINKSFIMANETCQDTEEQWKLSQREIENLSELLSRTHQELEQEKYQKITHYEERVRLNNENDRIKRELAVIREAYDQACRSAKAISTQLSPINSALFKETSLSFCEKTEGSLHRWVEAAVREINEISSKLSEAVQALEVAKHKNNLVSKENDKVNSEVSALRAREVMIKGQLDTGSKEISALKESFRIQVSSLQQEIVDLRSSMNGLYEEIDGLSTKNRSTNSELLQVRSKLATSEQSLANYEKKYKILLGEKEHLERMMNKSPIRTNI